MAKKLTILLLIVSVLLLSTEKAFASESGVESRLNPIANTNAGTSGVLSQQSATTNPTGGRVGQLSPVSSPYNPTTAPSQPQQPSSANLNCTNTTYSIMDYIGTVAGGLIELGLASTAAGATHFSILGFSINLSEGATTVTDLLLRHYTRAMLWGVIATLAILIIGYFFQFALTLNTAILSTPIIKEIYTMLLNMVDIGFVIALIVMAFATMFRNDKYGYKKNLPKFLAAALLINFGFFFAKAAINVGDTMTNVFADAVSGSQYTPNSTALPSNFGTAASLLDVFNVASITCSVNQYIDISKSNTSGLLGFFLTMLQPLMSISFGAVISLLWAATLLAIVIVFLARYAFLVLLVSVMPLAWLSWIFPGIKIPLLGGKGGTFEGWWSQFLNWIFIGPLLIFLLYISRSMTNWFTGNATAISTSQGALVFSSQLLLQLVIILIINTIGLFAAIKMSGAAGAMVVAGVGGGLGIIAQKVTSYSGGLAARAKIRSEAYEKSSAEAEKQGDISTARLHRTLARGFSMTSRTLSGVALPPQYREVLGRAGVKVPQEKEFDLSKSIAGAEGKYKQMISADVLRNARVAARNRIQDPVQSAALLKNLIDRRQLNNLTDAEITPLLTSAASVGAQKDILSARPDLAAVLGKKTADPEGVKDYMDEVRKAAARIKPDKIRDVLIPPPLPTTTDAEKARAKLLAPHEALLLGLTPQQVGQRLKAASPEEQESIIKAIKDLNSAGGRGGVLAASYKDKPDVLQDIQDRTQKLVSHMERGGSGRRGDPELKNIWDSF